MVKKTAIALILVLGFSQLNSVLADPKPKTPGNLLIVGGVLATIELAHQAIKYFSKRSGSKEAPVKLIETIPLPPPPLTIKTQIIATKVTQENRPQTNIQIAFITNKPPIEIKTVQTVQPVSITNQISEDTAAEIIKSYSYEWEDIEVDYYQVGLAYYRVGKKEKSREFMLHSIARKKNVKEAVEFLKQKFNMNDEQIKQQARAYR